MPGVGGHTVSGDGVRVRRTSPPPALRTGRLGDPLAPSTGSQGPRKKVVTA